LFSAKFSSRKTTLRDEKTDKSEIVSSAIKLSIKKIMEIINIKADNFL